MEYSDLLLVLPKRPSGSVPGIKLMLTRCKASTLSLVLFLVLEPVFKCLGKGIFPSCSWSHSGSGAVHIWKCSKMR